MIATVRAGAMGWQESPGRHGMTGRLTRELGVFLGTFKPGCRAFRGLPNRLPWKHLGVPWPGSFKVAL